MTAPVLTRREGVELARTGVWPTSTGIWTAEPEDFAAAVAATTCPAVRRPWLRLGHIDPRFGTLVPVQGDGEPALGWIENLRTTDSGHTLVGDYVGVPEWLDHVMASAYPDRSVEGKYSWRCQLGHTHPFVLTGLALLGVTPPGVGTLKPIESLSDVAGLFGLAATGDDNGFSIAATITGEQIAARFDPRQKRDDNGRWTDVPGGGAPPGVDPNVDKLKLAGRIKLGAGESLAGSDMVQTGDSVLPVAAIRTADGPRLRIGVGIAEDDWLSWRAANRGSTADLDRQAVNDLRDGLGAMFEAGERAEAQYKALVDREDDLKRRERDLIRSQYKNLTKTQGRELDRTDNRIGELEQQISRLDRRQRERVERLPADLQARWETAGRQERQKIIADWHESQPEWRGVGIGGFQRQDDEKRDRLTRDLETARQRREELTVGGGQMSAEDAAELERVRRELADLDGEFDDLESVDGSVSADWADITYEAYVDDGKVQYFLGINPRGGTGIESVPMTPAQIRDLDRMLERLTRAASGAEVKAAAETHSGAMVALIPTEADAARLAVDGGEPVEQLHVTLAYLGDAADLDPAARQNIIDAVSTAVNGAPVIAADGFYVAPYNPPGVTKADGKQRDTCIVVGWSGDDLDLIHTLVGDALNHSGVALPSQHAPWHAHTTLLYTDDLSRAVDLADRAGPVKFDRVRVALAGQHLDIPLIADAGPAPAEADDGLVEAAAGDDNALKEYWTRGPGLQRWVASAHPWTTLYGLLRRKVGSARAKRITSSFFHAVFGYWPGDRRHRKVAAQIGDTMPNPQPDLPERVRQAWNASKPYAQWLVRVDDGTVLACDEDAGRTFARVPYVVDGDSITFGEPQPLDGVPVAAMSADGGTVYASRAESRPGPAPDSPAAEPEPNTEPKEDPVSTSLSDVRSRLGLPDDADETAVSAAVLAELDKQAAPQPTPEQVAAAAAAEERVAAAAAENADLRKEVSVLASQVQEMSTKLATAEAEKQATVKASVLDEAQKQGKFTPAAREQWDKDYDEAPAAVTRVLAAIAPGTAVPVTVAGESGGAPEGDIDAEWAHVAHLFPADAASKEG